MDPRRTALAWTVALMTVAVVGCGADGDRPNAIGGDTTSIATDPPGTIATADSDNDGALRVADIVGDPIQYVGRQVTVVADVDEVIRPNAFVLDEDSVLEGGVDNDLLVFSRQGTHLTPLDANWLDNKVRVTGTVERMTRADLEREIGTNLGTWVDTEFAESAAVLVAQSVERLPS
jgi:hypothetical protein